MWCLSSDKKTYIKAAIVFIDKREHLRHGIIESVDFIIKTWDADGGIIRLGIYSTRAKADKVISELRNAVILDRGDFTFQKDEDIG